MKPENKSEFLKYTAKRTVPLHRFDFEVGYICKSPCRKCNLNNLPGCIDDCNTLDKIQTLLAGVISCTRNI